jgi:hypothetical protein
VQCLNQDDSKPIINALKAGAKCVLARRRCSRLAISSTTGPLSLIELRPRPRALAARESDDAVVQSDADEQLLIYIPFREVRALPPCLSLASLPHPAVHLTRVACLPPAADCEGPEHHYQVAGRRYVYRQPVLLPRDAPRGGRVHHRNMRACLQLRAPQGAAQRR